MTFNHFWLLWLLPLALIPLILHLLTLHRLKTVELPTFRFLFDSYVQQRRRMQFLEALLAMLRVLFLGFLILLFSLPAIDHWNALFGGGGAGGREVVLLMDTSASMNARSGGLSAFDRAKSIAVQLVDKLHSGDRLTLVKVGARPEEVFSKFNSDTQGIKERIESLQPSSARANLFAALLQLFGPEAARRENPAVYLFTDCQSNTWKEARNQGLDKLLPAEMPFTVVNVGSHADLPNRAVVGNAPRRNRAIAGLPFLLEPKVVNYSKTEPAEVTLNVFIDDKEVARTTVALKPGETLTKPVVYTPTEPGLRRGRFEISGKVPDRFPDDDRFLFTLNVEPRVKVVLVNGGVHPDPQLDEARYIHTALTSRAETLAEDVKPVPGKSTKDILRSLDVQEIPEAGLTPDVLRDASVVVLANCGQFAAPPPGQPTSDGRALLLQRFVRDGGGLLIFPGDKVTPDAYNRGLFPVPGPQGEKLTAALLGEAQGDPEKAETFEQLSHIDFSHSALSVFDSPDPDSRHFKTARFYKRFPLTFPKEKHKSRVLAFFGSGSPALVESNLGDGTVILAAFPAHHRWGSLPVKPDFVPLMLRLVSHAEHRPDAEVPPVVVADAASEISLSNTWDPATVTVKDPAGHSTEVNLERAGARLLGAFEKTSARGYYTVEARSRRSDNFKAADLAFAVNLAPEESDFSFLAEGDLRGLMPRDVNFSYVDGSSEAQGLYGAIGKQVEIWPYLIWLVFILIGAEFFLSTLSGRARGRGEEGPSVGERVMEVSTGAWVGKMTGAGQTEG
jgi:hypothetical protein